jgi:methionine-rich copper-binding protein CopC
MSRLLHPLLIAASLIAAAPAAMAHAILVDSTPAPNGHVPAGKLAITFRYNSRIDTSRSKLTLTAPDGSETRLDVADGPAPALLVAQTTVAPGDYTLRWQVLATDGHITRGSVPFTVDAAAASKAAK